MKLLKLIILMLTWLLCIALSPRPNPIPGTTHDQHRKSASEQENTNRTETDQRAPRPTISVIPVIPTDRAAEDRAAAESAKRAAEQEAHYKRQEELAAGTLAVTQRTLDIDSKLVWLTAILAAINLSTMAVFYCTLRESIKAANAADVSAQAAKISADAALGTVFLQQRPRIKVRSVSTDPKLESNEFHLQIANIGGTVASIVSSNFTISSVRISELPHEPYKPEGNGFIQTRECQLESGTSNLVITKATLNPVDLENIEMGRVYALGWIKYEGKVAGVVYTTAFCRRWRRERGRFVPVENEAYEYQD